jgi:hypothetical protein
MTVYPIDKAWSYFIEHHDDIRTCVEQYLPTPYMEVPNTRLHVGDDVVIRQSGEEQRGTMPLKVCHTIEDFDRAVEAKRSSELYNIMNDAWLRLPEDRTIYREPGVMQMCNLLDFTVTGFVDDDPPDDDDEEPAF